MSFEILKQQSRPAGVPLGVAAFGDAVGDFRNLENRIGFGLDALQFAGAVERGDPLAEVVEGQRIPLWVTDDYKGLAASDELLCHGFTRINADKAMENALCILSAAKTLWILAASGRTRSG